MTGHGWWTVGRRRVMPAVWRRAMARSRRKGGLARKGALSARKVLAALDRVAAR